MGPIRTTYFEPLKNMCQMHTIRLMEVKYLHLNSTLDTVIQHSPKGRQYLSVLFTEQFCLEVVLIITHY